MHYILCRDAYAVTWYIRTRRFSGLLILHHLHCSFFFTAAASICSVPNVGPYISDTYLGFIRWRSSFRHSPHLFSGNFTVLAVSFRLKRHLGFYVIQDFIPTLLIVMLSWVGFWIDDHCVPARVSLGITTVLSITTLFFGIQATLPKVGYVKAIDYYLLGSFFFVFGALIEFAIICTVKGKSISKTEIPSSETESAPESHSLHARWTDRNTRSVPGEPKQESEVRAS